MSSILDWAKKHPEAVGSVLGAGVGGVHRYSRTKRYAEKYPAYERKISPLRSGIRGAAKGAVIGAAGGALARGISSDSAKKLYKAIDPKVPGGIGEMGRNAKKIWDTFNKHSSDQTALIPYKKRTVLDFIVNNPEVITVPPLAAFFGHSLYKKELENEKRRDAGLYNDHELKRIEKGKTPAPRHSRAIWAGSGVLAGALQGASLGQIVRQGNKVSKSKEEGIYNKLPFLRSVTSKKQAEKVWREVARNAHPDLGGDLRKFQAMSDAWREFKDMPGGFSKLSNMLPSLFHELERI